MRYTTLASIVAAAAFVVSGAAGAQTIMAKSGMSADLVLLPKFLGTAYALCSGATNML